jgi:hypothetical protein
MNTFIIAYKMRNVQLDFYKKLIEFDDKIKELSNKYFYLYEQVIYIQTNLSIDELYDELYPYVNEKGTILIQEVTISNTTTSGILSPSFREWCGM